MKVCPQCRGRFDDSLGRCPDDDSILIPEGAPGNPAQQVVTPVDEGAETQMFDVENFRDELDAVPDDGPTPFAASASAAQVPHAGTLSAGNTRMHAPDEVKPVMQESSTEANPARGLSREKPKKQRKLRAGLVAFIAVGVLLLVLVVVVLLLLWPKETALSIVTSPSGASVEIDEVLSGETPTSIIVSPGSHAVTIRHEGFQAFSQVINVPRGGRPLTVALVKRDSPEQADNSEATEEGNLEFKMRADSIFAELEALEKVGDYDLADARLQVLAVMVPDDPRVAAGLKRLAELKAKAAKKETANQKQDSQKKPAKHVVAIDTGPNPAQMSRSQRERYADKMFQKGRRLYRAKKIAEAKEYLLRSIRYDASFYPPHRVLARVYNREKNIKKAKYHLSRYIDLGGPDKDYKIRQWLASH